MDAERLARIKEKILEVLNADAHAQADVLVREWVEIFTPALEQVFRDEPDQFLVLLQAALIAPPSTPKRVSFPEARKREWRQIHLGRIRRRRFAAVRELALLLVPYAGEQKGAVDEIAWLLARRMVSAAGDAEPDRQIGLSFSGGGIRSATFNLGVLQALAHFRMLGCIDYLSTVSGGGYIGSWLAGWIRQQESLKNVERHLSPRESPNPNAPGVRPIRFLSQFSNYLTPKLGAFSVDTWTMIAIWLRNTLLNLLTLVATLCAVLMVPYLVSQIWFHTQAGPAYGWTNWDGLAMGLAVAALVIACLFTALNLRDVGHVESEGETVPLYVFQKSIQWLIVGPLFLAAYLSSGLFWRYVHWAPSLDWNKVVLTACFIAGIAFAMLNYGLCWIGGFGQNYKRERGKNGWRARWALAWRSLIASLIGGGLMLWGVAHLLIQWPASGSGPWLVSAFGAPLFIMIFSLVLILQIGLMGRSFSDSRREWCGRLKAWLLIYLVAWLSLFGATFFSPLLVAKIAGAWTASGLTLGWIATTIATLLAGRSGATSGKQAIEEKSTFKPLDMLAKVGPYVFLAGLFILLSLAIYTVLVPHGFEYHLLTPSLHWSQLHEIPMRTLLLALGVLAAITLTFSRCVDVNEFSLHHFYRNRLIRCYLGASRQGERHPNRFTEFDDADDVPLAQFHPENFRYCGPYPIVNATLNLTAGEDLGWQERKAASFVFTPEWSGFDVTCEEAKRTRHAASHSDMRETLADEGYRPTREYGNKDGGITLGTAAAISGAAASPNQGYHSSPATAFLMTLFDVRLGWWLGNPRDERTWRKPGPSWGLLYLLKELMGSTNDKSSFVYLSDGGHFENLGIYELVRRGCYYIIACDSEEDHALGFSGLGNAIRKCRTDLGVDIRISTSRLLRSKESGFSGAHCLVGDIVYRDGTTGTLVYVKSSLTGDEPSDVLQYAGSEPAFPHQSTADQWFGESQFESYRQLGFHVAETSFSPGCPSLNSNPDAFFGELRKHWYPPCPEVEMNFTKHSEAFTKLRAQLSSDPNLYFLDAQICPEWRDLMGDRMPPPSFSSTLWLPSNYDEMRSGFYFCNSLIQMMENVYLDLDLEEHWEHPDNRGWMNLFHRWAWSGMFRVTWAASASCYGARFQTFCERRLHLSLGKISACRGSVDDLNPFERNLASQLLVPQTDEIWTFNMSTEDPTASGEPVAFCFGFAVLDTTQGAITYFRVQDHLRKMGLARQALRELLGSAPHPVKVGIRELPPDFPEKLTKRERQSLDRLLATLL